MKVPSSPLNPHRSSKLKNVLFQLIAIPIITRIAIKGIFYSFFLSKNIKKIHAPVSPKVKTLNVENVRLIISIGFVRGVSSEAKKKAFIFYMARGKN